MQVDDDGVFGMMDVPEDALSVLIEGAGGDDPRNLRARHAEAMPPSAGDLRVGVDSSDVHERNFKSALECPELIGAADVQRQLAFGDAEVDHCVRLNNTRRNSATDCNDTSKARASPIADEGASICRPRILVVEQHDHFVRTQ